MGAAALMPIAPKLAKLLPLLSSDQPGEVVATAAAIGRTLAAAGATWHDLAGAFTPDPIPTPPPMAGTSDTLTMAERLWSKADLTDWERRFVASLRDQLQRGRRLSEKQAVTLKKIYGERLGGGR